MTDAVRVLEAADVTRLLARVDTAEVMRSLFHQLALGRASAPPQALTPFPGGDGDFIVSSGVLSAARVFGVKLSPFISRPGGALLSAWTVLMSMDTGRPLLVCDALQLTVERTAATTALAVQLLARPAATRLAIIGTGPVAQAHLRHARALREWSEIRLYSRTLSRDLERQDALHALDPRVFISSSVDDAVRDADVVMLCTSSATPVVDPTYLTRSALITSISMSAERAREVPPPSLHSMDVYCDDRTTTPLVAGEMVLAAADEDWSPADIAGDLGDLVARRGQLLNHDTHTFFRSIGMGLADVAMARAILAPAERDDGPR